MSDHLAAPSANVRNVWKYWYTLAYILVRWGIMKYIGCFTFTSVVFGSGTGISRLFYLNSLEIPMLDGTR
jgi:hypothetical protein